MPRAKTDTSHLRDFFGHLNLHSDIAAYKQIETVVRCGIASGTLKAEERLPAIRELSEWLDVNQITVSGSQFTARDSAYYGLISPAISVPGVSRS